MVFFPFVCYSTQERAIPSGGLRRGDLEEWWTYDLPELRSDGTGAIANEADAAMPESVFISHTNAQSVIDENLDNLDVCPVAFQGDDGEEYVALGHVWLFEAYVPTL